MCDSCQWADTLDELDEMIEDSRYKFANDFLSSVREFVQKNEHITAKQAGGIRNIKASVARRERR